MLYLIYFTNHTIRYIDRDIDTDRCIHISTHIQTERIHT